MSNLVNLRTGEKSACTKCANQLRRELDLTLPDKVKIENLTTIIEKKLNRIEQLTETILSSELDLEKITTEKDNELTYELNIRESVTEAKNYLKDSASAALNASINLNRSLNSESIDSVSSVKVKLPQIILSKFDDTIAGWTTFWDSFSSAVDKRKDLTPSQKFTYLKGQLQGDSLTIIDRLPIEDGNYQIAVRLLKETYENRTIAIISQVEKLQSLKVNEFNLLEVRKFRAEFEGIISNLELLDCKVDTVSSSETLVICMVLNKLPKVMRDNMKRSAGDNILKLKQFKIALKTEMDLLCNNYDLNACSKVVSNTKINKFNGKSNSNGKGFNSDKINSTCNFSVTSSDSNKSNKGFSRPNQAYCHFCDVIGHTSNSCSSFPDFHSRMNKLKSMGNRCNNCWFRNHGNQPCVVLKCKKCNSNHWTALCNKSNNGNSTNVNSIVQGNVVALPIFRVSYFNSEMRCLLDQCSQRTLILKETVNKFAIPVIKTEYLTISGFGGEGKHKKYDLVEFTFGNESRLVKLNAVVVDSLPEIKIDDIKHIVQNLKSKNVNLADSKLQFSYINDIDLLVGNDFYYDIVRTDKLPYNIDNVWLLPTWFGDCITGRLPVQSISNYKTNAVTILKVAVQEFPWKNETLPETENVDKLWLLDNIGILDKCNKDLDCKVLEKFNETIVYNDGQYMVQFPWKIPKPNLPSNFMLAKGRLISLMKRFKGDAELFNNYNKVIKEQLNNKFIEVVPDGEVVRQNTHYLPHHPIIRNHPTTPIRIVMDCSARIKGCPSLNDCLSTGPSLVPLLAQIILRLRLSKFICAGDISKAFLRVQLAEQDRDCTRFLWFDEQNPNRLVTYRFCVVLFGSASSPFLLQATIKYHLDKCGLQFLGRNLYCDNLHGCANTEDELISFYKKSIDTYNSAGLPLREWVTNSPKLKEIVINEGLGPSKDSNDVRILGIYWKMNSDQFYIKTPVFSSLGKATKRSVLQDSSKLYDPLGFIMPISILSRVFIQKLWKLDYTWDQNLDDSLQLEWRNIVKIMTEACSVCIPRHVIKNKVISLHLFSDASSLIYGTCAYAVENNNSDLLMCKARVAPVKELTIPKLELMGALLSCRLALFLMETFEFELTIDSLHIWIDNQAVLAWIMSEKEIKNVFVRNRVNEIKNNLPQANFHYVPSELNPADIVTKFKYKDLSSCVMWWKGPEFLCNPSDWPEWKPKYVEENLVLSANQPVQATFANYNSGLPDPVRFSSWTKLLNSTCYIFRFLSILNNRLIGKLNPNEIINSEIVWIKEVQSRWYAIELNYLNNIKTYKGKVPQLVKDLWLIIDRGIIRINTRLQHSSLTFDERYPILLPSKDYVTNLIIKDIHENSFHSSVSNTMSTLRQKFWVAHCRQTVKKVINNCFYCKRYNIKRYNIPVTPPLPKFRINESRPFQFTGVDYTGALYVKDSNLLETKKVYMVLFTCCSTRAVHLDLAEDSSSYAFAKVYRRFVSRRSALQLMLSDNTTNFLGFVPQLEEFQSHPSIVNLLNKNKTSWRFIPARAPWFGGIWERLIGITKGVIKKALGKKLVTYDELLTIIIEVEGRVNDRPLTYLSSSSEDNIPISPSQLVNGHKINSLPSVVDEIDLDEDYQFENPSNINKKHRNLLEILNQFWSLWRKEYLLSLKERDKKMIPVKDSGDILAKEGDVVLLMDNIPNSQWKLGRIIKLYSSPDNENRVAQLKTSFGITTRPLAKLCHLESVTIDKPSFKVIDNPNIELSVRPKRKQALKAQSKIIDWAHKGLV